jgi:large subunit ribosomal protein L2
MGIKKYRVVTPGTRFSDVPDFSEITKSKPEKSLTKALPKKGGRNNLGRKTVSSQGGGHKRRYRIIDFRYSKKGFSGVVEAIEYDPNRSSYVALMRYEDGDKRYIIAPEGLRVGMTLQCGPGSKIETGNSMPLREVPAGSTIYCIELSPGRGAQIARSAGGGAILAAKDGNDIHLKMPSGEVRLVSADCYASIGRTGNADHEKISLGKAGRSRHLGRRPKSRGVAKNPVDHPMGGGEGKSSGGRHPTTPWGKITKGLKTRKRNKASSRRIIKRRK